MECNVELISLKEVMELIGVKSRTTAKRWLIRKGVAPVRQKPLYFIKKEVLCAFKPQSIV
jgi:hypothetical protein